MLRIVSCSKTIVAVVVVDLLIFLKNNLLKSLEEVSWNYVVAVADQRSST